MPVYEYTCIDCGNKFDILRSMKDADKPTQCLKCQSNHTRRMLSKVFSKIEGNSVTSQSSGCGGCNGGSCTSCHH
jgi:putative FmdB family regulatory protein